VNNGPFDIILDKEQQAIYRALAEGYHLPLECVQRKFLLEFSANHFSHAQYKFTSQQLTLLKRLTVVSGVIEDIDDLDNKEKGEIFRLIARIRNTQRLKVWGESSFIPSFHE